jgi:hypothetical protein
MSAVGVAGSVEALAVRVLQATARSRSRASLSVSCGVLRGGSEGRRNLVCGYDLDMAFHWHRVDGHEFERGDL